MTDSKKRSGRSNSLQRMLELEKKYNFDRLHPPHSQLPASSNPNSQPPAATVFKNASPPRQGIHARRTEAKTQKYRRKSNVPLRDPSLPPQLPPLVINTGVPITMNRPDVFAGRGRDYSPRDQDSTMVPTPSDKYPKVVSFEFPPTESAPAPCHSPSWEAYERRKTEKKTEKKEREESRNGRTKKLVKPPPASSPYSTQHASASDVDANRGRRRERADSSTAVNNSGNPRKARSRSGSFVSLLRAPFEFRRPSIDQSTDSSFIGGIKLEIQRNAATQQVLDHQAVEDQSNVHPVLRKGKQTDRYSAPLKSPPPPPRAGADGENQRRYPPITRSKYHHKTTSLVSPTAPAIPDLNTIDRWRVKVGLRPGSRPGSRMSSDNDSCLDETNVAATDLKQKGSEPRDAWHLGLARPASASLTKPMHVVFPASPPSREKMLENKPTLDHNNNVSILSCSTGGTFETAPSSPPPEPPRRSAKRSSILGPDGSTPRLPSPRNSSEKPSPVKDAPPQLDFPFCGDEFQFKDTVNDQAIGAPVLLRQPATYIASPGSHLPGSSSEDSGSEDLHSTSIVSTPATSRPQSEKSMPLEAPKDEAPEPERNKNKMLLAVPHTTTYPLHSTENSEDETNDIQAVAKKVLQVYNDIPVQVPGLRRRSNSQSTLNTDASTPPAFKERPLKLRPKSHKPGLPHLASLACPAIYLEEARRQPPSASAHRTRRQHLGPPASFVLPDSDSEATAVEKKLPPIPDIVGRSLRHKSTPLLSTSDREPVAKVFVECCNCKYYHDMPSNLYEAMANPEGVLSPVDKLGYAGALSTAVKCSWCRHEMNTRCCAGLAATVYIKERLH